MAQWKQILVGVDGSPASRTALEWAGDEAVRHGAELVLLTAYLSPPPPPSSGTVSVHEATSSSEAASETAKQLLMETIQDVLGEDPPVVVHPRVKEGNAAKPTSPRTPICSWSDLAATAGSPGCSWAR